MKRFLRILFPILTLFVIAFIFTNSFSDSLHAEAKRAAVVKAVTGSDSFSKQALRVVAKIFHTLEFAAFSFCLTVSTVLYGGLKNGRFERILLCGILIAVTDELIQTISSGRGSRVSDVVVDTAGVMIGYGLALLATKILSKRAENKKKGT